MGYAEKDTLTGLLYNRAFLCKAKEYLLSPGAGKSMIVSIDINNFRLFNKLYGRDTGDKLLVYFAKCLTELVDTAGGVAGYFGADNFALVMSKDMEAIMQLRARLIEGIEKYGDILAVLPMFGVYAVKDATEDIEVMFDCAAVALKRAKESQTGRICEYNQDIEDKLDEEATLITEIREGIKNDEFIFYIQPQCDISTGKVVGGESLVRWKHADKGLVSPAVFVPVLEKCGFIAELDKYIWEKVCIWLRSWIDKGFNPVPVSINISRIDIFAMDVAEFLKSLIEKYDLDTSLLKVEITESAYAESNDKIIKTVKQLRDSSFLVMMDDFGSGYSSLNMLNSIAVDVLKIDMRFLDISGEAEEKGVGILETVINMARQMKIPVVVEGVETQKQENYLLRMGCRYSQGYYYFRPMPVEDFENLIKDERNVDYNGMWCRQVEQIHVREFLDSNMFNDTIINNILGAAAFYDVYDNRIEVMRVNEQYYSMAGVSSKEEADNSKSIATHVRDDDRAVLFRLFESAFENQMTGAEGYIHYVRTDGQVLWVKIKVYYLRENDGHKLFYGSLTDMTYMQEHNSKESIEMSTLDTFSDKHKNSLAKYYGNMPCGYAVAKVVVDCFGVPYDYDIFYINREMSKICGGDIDRLRHLALRAFAEKRNIFMDKMYRAAYLGDVVEHSAYSSVSGRYLHMTFYQYEPGYVSCIVRDITHTYIYQNTLDSIVNSYREVYYLHLKDNYIRMIHPDENHMLDRGNYEDMVRRHFDMGRILSDEQEVRDFLNIDNIVRRLNVENVIECRYLRHTEQYGDEKCLVTISVCERENGQPKTATIMIKSLEAVDND